jgi:hypothetical protein
LSPDGSRKSTCWIPINFICYIRNIAPWSRCWRHRSIGRRAG